MSTDFHFNEWAFLSKTDALAFERKRLRLLEEFMIRSGSHRQALQSLQVEIDRRRAAAANPEQAVAAISAMMCDSFSTLVAELGELRSELTKLRRPLCRSKTSAGASPLPSRRTAATPAAPTII